MRAAFRTLATLTALLWGFFPFGSSYAASPYTNPVAPGSYYSSGAEACTAVIPDLEAAFAAYGGSLTIKYAYKSFSYDGLCNYTYVRSDGATSGNYAENSSGTNGEISAAIIQSACVSGESKTLYFSGGVAPVNGTPYATATAPATYCISGCNYNRNSNQQSCSISGETSTCSFSFVSDAATCNSSPSSDDPTQPPSTGGDTGGTGGDTGGTGGDTGGTGGDTGGTGGDTGGTGGDTGGTGGDTSDPTDAATSCDIDKLGDRVVGAITDLGDRLSAQLNALDGLGTAYDSSAEWSDGEASAVGEGAGEGVSDAIGTAVDDAVAEHEAEVEDALSDVPGQVEGMFGDAPLDSLRNILPSPKGCSDYIIPFSVMQYSFQLTLPVCFLAAIKPLLEWLMWCLTAIGVWNIFYSGLRLENAKASKGGY